MTRTYRAVLALIAAFGVLFAQIAVAAYACPMTFAQKQAMEQPAQDHGCCGDAVNAGEHGLCKAHCSQGKQSLDKRSLTVPDVGASMPALAAPGTGLLLVASEAPRELPSLLSRPTEPPHALRDCCLRF